jgi:tyrosine-protein kinase Etk/Wzc
MLMQSQVREGFADDGGTDILRIFSVVLSNRWLVVGVALVFLIIGAAYAFLATPIFEANMLVEVEAQISGITSLSDITDQLTSPDTSSDTEVQIIESRSVLGQAVDKENLTILVSARGIFGLPFITLNNDTDLEVSSLSVPEDLETSKIDVFVGDGGSYRVAYHGDEIGAGHIGIPMTGLNGQFKLLITKIVAPSGSRFKITHLPREYAIANLADDLQVEKQSKSAEMGIIQLTLDGQDKQKTTDILQKVADAYVEQNILRRSEESNKSLAFLRDQLPKVKNDLYKSEDALNTFRLERGSLDMDLEAKSVLEQNAILQQQLSDLAVNQSKIGHLFTPAHPAFKVFLEQRASLERLQEALKQKVSRMPDSQQKLLRLTRDVVVNEQIYLQMFEKIQELDVVRAGTVGNVRIIDSAATEWLPVRPKKGLVIALSFAMGLLVGVLIAMFRDFMNPGIEDAEELENSGMPVLAVVPLSEEQIKVEKDFARDKLKARKGGRLGIRKPRYLLSILKPEDLAIEALRGLRTSLHFEMLSAKNNVVMISGPSPLVGKSFISSNLSVVLAQSGKRVLIIDADMRRGGVHEFFGLPPHEGLSELLLGKLTRDAVIKHTNIAGLDVIGRGMAPDNPAELLLSGKMNELIAWANDNYDIILVDTPPILAVTDAAIVGRLAGLTILVVRHRKNSVSEIRHTAKRFTQNGVDITGYVMNGLKYEGGYGYNKYGYYSYKYESTRTSDE